MNHSCKYKTLVRRQSNDRSTRRMKHCLKTSLKKHIDKRRAKTMRKKHNVQNTISRRTFNHIRFRNKHTHNNRKSLDKYHGVRGGAGAGVSAMFSSVIRSPRWNRENRRKSTFMKRSYSELDNLDILSRQFCDEFVAQMGMKTRESEIYRLYLTDRNELKTPEDMDSELHLNVSSKIYIYYNQRQDPTKKDYNVRTYSCLIIGDINSPDLKVEIKHYKESDSMSESTFDSVEPVSNSRSITSAIRSIKSTASKAAMAMTISSKDTKETNYEPIEVVTYTPHSQNSDSARITVGKECTPYPAYYTHVRIRITKGDDLSQDIGLPLELETNQTEYRRRKASIESSLLQADARYTVSKDYTKYLLDYAKLFKNKWYIENGHNGEVQIGKRNFTQINEDDYVEVKLHENPTEISGLSPTVINTEGYEYKEYDEAWELKLRNKNELWVLKAASDDCIQNRTDYKIDAVDNTVTVDKTFKTGSKMYFHVTYPTDGWIHLSNSLPPSDMVVKGKSKDIESGKYYVCVVKVKHVQERTIDVDIIVKGKKVRVKDIPEININKTNDRQTRASVKKTPPMVGWESDIPLGARVIIFTPILGLSLGNLLTIPVLCVSGEMWFMLNHLFNQNKFCIDTWYDVVEDLSNSSKEASMRFLVMSFIKSILLRNALKYVKSKTSTIDINLVDDFDKYFSSDSVTSSLTSVTEVLPDNIKCVIKLVTAAIQCYEKWVTAQEMKKISRYIKLTKSSEQSYNMIYQVLKERPGILVDRLRDKKKLADFIVDYISSNTSDKTPDKLFLSLSEGNDTLSIDTFIEKLKHNFLGCNQTLLEVLFGVNKEDTPETKEEILVAQSGAPPPATSATSPPATPESRIKNTITIQDFLKFAKDYPVYMDRLMKNLGDYEYDVMFDPLVFETYKDSNKQSHDVILVTLVTEKGASEKPLLLLLQISPQLHVNRTKKETEIHTIIQGCIGDKTCFTCIHANILHSHIINTYSSLEFQKQSSNEIERSITKRLNSAVKAITNCWGWRSHSPRMQKKAVVKEMEQRAEKKHRMSQITTQITSSADNAVSGAEKIKKHVDENIETAQEVTHKVETVLEDSGLDEVMTQAGLKDVTEESMNVMGDGLDAMEEGMGDIENFREMITNGRSVMRRFMKKNNLSLEEIVNTFIGTNKFTDDQDMCKTSTDFQIYSADEYDRYQESKNCNNNNRFRVSLIDVTDFSEPDVGNLVKIGYLQEQGEQIESLNDDNMPHNPDVDQYFKYLDNGVLAKFLNSHFKDKDKRRIDAIQLSKTTEISTDSHEELGDTVVLTEAGLRKVKEVTDTREPNVGANVGEGACTITIKSGYLGLDAEDAGINSPYSFQFSGFSGTSNAEELAAGKLEHGWLLTHINGKHMEKTPYNTVLKTLRNRPCTLIFRDPSALGPKELLALEKRYKYVIGSKCNSSGKFTILVIPRILNSDAFDNMSFFQEVKPISEADLIKERGLPPNLEEVEVDNLTNMTGTLSMKTKGSSLLSLGKNYKSYFFMLEANNLNYYDNEDDRDRELINSFDLTKCDIKEGRKAMIQITTTEGNTHVLKAGSVDEARTWVELMNKVKERAQNEVSATEGSTSFVVD